MHEDVLEAGMRALRHVADTNGGRLPAKLEDVLKLPAAYGLGLEPARCGYKLVIAVDDEFVTYDPTDTVHTQMCGIMHELVEKICVGDYPTLFDGLPGTEYHRTGEGAPRDFRHQVAAFAERVYSAWLMRQ